MVQIFRALIALVSPSAFASGNVIGGGTVLLIFLPIVIASVYVVVRMYKGPRKIVKDFNYRYISIGEVSKRSGKSIDALVNEIEAGRIKGKEFQSGWFVSREELIRLKI